MGDTGSLFLDRLDVTSRKCLFSHLVPVTLTRGEPVYQPDAPMDKVIFPIDGAVSVVTEMTDGSTVEVGFIGREGMTGLPLVLGGGWVPQRAYVQIAGNALSASEAALRGCLRGDSELKAYSLRYAQATLASVSQFAACNKLHSVNERCARWLLMAHDRVTGDVVHLTHEFLSLMLGVRRSGVTVAASTLAAAGLIEYARGTIVVLDREGLERTSCECYATIEDAWKRIVGYSIRKLPSQTVRPKTFERSQIVTSSNHKKG